ncbi:DNA-binding transcriptional MerR regulator [Arthrobacter sp. PvP102]|jgi:DNA-binding transcriptional MerR regulator|uniref:MerR family transcriptional regulator n=1 Tax=unclassified Arthrobacter TaxID=235627 RepID=UPI001AE2F7FA|nr:MULTISPECIES: MerR family transcriptional regulator [unclassified Arthrobacter]MBP1232046.1 DNA-binding transcriptional MerR regulator [Arthrobacter sp. PvP103]MBP1237181.1 DNA-binding transcriptional MerR regulator [Arthrobacter sp. PvP102]
MKQEEHRSWSIAEVARLSKVSSRTLRHYHQLGILDPAYTGQNGYRYYGQEQLFRLQRILLLRELGLGLEAIADVLAGQTSQLEALAVHREWLLAEHDRLGRMAATVDATMTALRQGDTMSAEEIFKDFDNNPYEEEARQRWGDQAVEDSKARHAAMSDAAKKAFMQEAQDINEELARCFDAGLQAAAPEVQAVVDRHYKWVCASWTPDAEGYVGLGRMYVEDPRFTAFYDKSRAGLAPYLFEGIKAYAAARLS